MMLCARAALARVQIPERRFENFLAQADWVRLRSQTVVLGALGTPDGDDDDDDDDDGGGGDADDDDDDEVLSRTGRPRSDWTNRPRARRGACCAWQSTPLGSISASMTASGTNHASAISSNGA